jgi:hypothetical protein
MTIDKAILILSWSADMGVTTFDQDFKDAERLGIEALKRPGESVLAMRLMHLTCCQAKQKEE